MHDFILRRLDSSNSMRASDILNEKSTTDDALTCIFMLIYATEHQFKIEKLENMIETPYFKISNFKITKEGQI